MQLNGENLDIDKLVNENIEEDFLKKYGNNILLNKKHIEILNSYGIDYHKYKDVSSLIFDIEEYLDDSYMELDDLEWVLEDLSERNYYQNTDK